MLSEIMNQRAHQNENVGSRSQKINEAGGMQDYFCRSVTRSIRKKSEAGKLNDQIRLRFMTGHGREIIVNYRCNSSDDFY